MNAINPVTVAPAVPIAATYGLLENVDFPHPSAWFTYGVVTLVWGCVQPFVARRYR